MGARYLVKTDYGDVVVEVNEACENALDGELLLLEKPTAQHRAELSLETPLRAFAAKMVDIIETVGTGNFTSSPRLLQMMVQEKATAELKRIERFAQKN
ncbi:MAG: hypothetical protein JSV66_18585 [Trueperaceae bacterium]|nr:MAG: hypothetical protein JSV66_18585 [Trueperaceae bacterium]